MVSGLGQSQGKRGKGEALNWGVLFLNHDMTKCELAFAVLLGFVSSKSMRTG